MSVHRTYVLLVLLVPFLAACTQEPATPAVEFIGVGTGTLLTPVEQIVFRDRFKTTERELLGVVQFRSAQDGARVMASWFSPDERGPPFGRTSIVTGSGARIARFSIASREAWRKAPYIFRVDASAGEDEELRTSSGSAAFFIGMTEKEIDRYRGEYRAWEEAREAARRAREEREKSAAGSGSSTPAR